MTKPKGSGRTKRHIDWGKVRDAFEHGGPDVTFSSLARDGWASRSEISKKAKEQGWMRPDPTTPEMRKKIRDRADEKSAQRAVSGEVLGPEPPPLPPGPSPAAVDAQVEARANIIDRHRKEINLARNRIYSALQQPNSETFQKLKEGKIAAEALSIIHADERKSWGLDGDPTIILQVIPPSQRDMNDD